MGLAHHASHCAAKDHVGGRAGAARREIEGLAVDADRQAAQNDRGTVDAVVEADQPDVVLVQAFVGTLPKTIADRLWPSGSVAILFPFAISFLS